MERGDGYVIASPHELERAGNWTLVRRSLGAQSFGVNLVEIPPGEAIPEHDERGRDQEELFFVVSGSPALVIDGIDHETAPGVFALLAPERRRTLRNDGDAPCTALIISAPTTSGFEPMDWA
jgi:uncharacterized cupin superfamily protein